MKTEEISQLMKGIADETRQAIKTEVELASRGLVTMDEFSKKMEALGESSKKIDELTKALETQGEEIRKFFENGTAKNSKSFEEVIEEKAKEIKGLSKASNSGRDNVSLKITKDMLDMDVQKTLVQRTAVSGNTMAYRVPGIGVLPVDEPVMSTLFRHVTVGPDSAGVIRYLDQNTITRGANTVAEGATKPESAITWIERVASIEKIADSIPVTKEAWNDLSFIKGEIYNLLNLNINLKVDQQLWDGDGVSPNLKGIYTYASAYAGTTFNDSVNFANLSDLAAVIAADISSNKNRKYQANTIVINPVDALRLKLIKTSEGVYINSPLAGLVPGLRVVESSQVDANTMLIGDFRYGTIYDLEGYNIEMGWVNDQFIKNQMTILAEQRLMLLVRNVDVDAFRKVTDITAALAAIETP